MKNLNPKTLVELFGVIAIAGSLIFVGLQMRQAQQIAMNESGWNNQNAQLDLRTAINDHADIWARGNSGASLDAAESVIYGNLIASMNSRAFESYTSRGRLGASAKVPVHDLSGFLFENPGARKAWEEHRATLRRYRQPHMQDITPFAELVRAELVILENLASDNE